MARTRPAAEGRDYSEASIRVLKGLEPVRQRPGMYTRTDSPLHIVQEVIDNASDEVLAGCATRVDVTVHKDGSITVEDDGRGIPVGLHPEEGQPVIELVFTRLHAGGKFEKGGANAYSFSGGLHGVGVSVTNALSSRLDVTVWRDGRVHTIAFADGEVSSCALVARGDRAASRPAARASRSGRTASTSIRSRFRRTNSSACCAARRCCLPGAADRLAVRSGWEATQLALRGRAERVPRSSRWPRRRLRRCSNAEGYAPEEDPTWAEGEGARWVLAWTEEGAMTRESFVNLIPTPAGGTHEAGLREGVFNAIRAFAEAHGLVPKGVKLLPDDVFGRVSFLLSAKVLDPQFQGQIKERLNSRDAVRLIASFVRPQLEFWLNQNPQYGRSVADLAIRQAQARTREAQKIQKRKGSALAVLPGKLTDCESTDLTRNELFLVEGDSAGGSAKMGRDKEYQAILPLRGKVLNTWEVERDRLFAQRRGARHRDRDRRRSAWTRRRGRPGQPALRQDLHPGRCRRRRLAHPGAAADAVLPALPPPGRARPRVRGATAAVPHRRAGAGAPPARGACTAWTRPSATPRWSSCATKAYAMEPGRSAASRAWARCPPSSSGKPR